MTDTLAWTEKTTEIPAGGLNRDRAATPTELKQVAEALGILGASKLSVHYRVVAISGGAYRLTGTLAADVEQACVVSLEPVGDNLKAAFEVEFWPDLKPTESDEEASILNGTDAERLEHGLIPVGRIVYETLSASLDPYPRREGAEFDWQDKAAEKSDSANPFSALSKLKGQG